MKFPGSYLKIYSLWLLMPSVPLLATLAPSYQVLPAFAAWLPLIVAFVIFPIFQLVFPFRLPEIVLPTRVGHASKLLLNILIISAIPFQAAILIIGAQFFASLHPNYLSMTAYLLGIGAYSSYCSINVGHELAHSRPRLSKKCGPSNHTCLIWSRYSSISLNLFSVIMLSATCFGVFYSTHDSTHHKHVGTPKDIYTAKRGESIYSFMRQTLRFNLKSLFLSFKISDKPAHAAKNRLTIFSTLLSLLWLLLFALGFGLAGLVFFVGQSIIAVLLTESINYLQHYGIERHIDTNGKPEPVREWHSWNEDNWLSDIYMLNLFRHADHHVNPSKPFFTLNKAPGGLSYPYPYTLMIFISLVPALYFELAHRVLDQHPYSSFGSRVESPSH